MDMPEALSAVSAYTADQWGMVTTAQAIAIGVDSVTLYRLADAGHLEPVRRGVYAAAAAPVSAYRDVQAVWLWLNPSVPAWKRSKLDPDGGVVSHTTAALLHEVGDMLADRIVLTVPRRRSSRDPLVQLRQQKLTEADVSLVDGLPVTTVARTIEDLLADHIDGSQVAAAIKDGVQAGSLSLDDLDDRIGPYARRYGVRSRNGDRLVDHLLDQIGTSRSALARAPATEPFMPKLLHVLSQMHAMNSRVSKQVAKPEKAALARIGNQILKLQQASAQAPTAKKPQRPQPAESDPDEDEES